MRLTPIDERCLATDDLLDTPANGLVPRCVNVRLIFISIPVHTEQKLVSRFKALISIEGLARLNVVRQLRSHASSVERRTAFQVAITGRRQWDVNSNFWHDLSRC